MTQEDENTPERCHMNENITNSKVSRSPSSNFLVSRKIGSGSACGWEGKETKSSLKHLSFVRLSSFWQWETYPFYLYSTETAVCSTAVFMPLQVDDNIPSPLSPPVATCRLPWFAADRDKTGSCFTKMKISWVETLVINRPQSEWTKYNALGSVKVSLLFPRLKFLLKRTPQETHDK